MNLFSLIFIALWVVYFRAQISEFIHGLNWNQNPMFFECLLFLYGLLNGFFSLEKINFQSLQTFKEDNS